MREISQIGSEWSTPQEVQIIELPLIIDDHKICVANVKYVMQIHIHSRNKIFLTHLHTVLGNHFDQVDQTLKINGLYNLLSFWSFPLALPLQIRMSYPDESLEAMRAEEERLRQEVEQLQRELEAKEKRQEEQERERDRLQEENAAYEAAFW
uniref:UBX domain-containing protein n=1 Tax=Steinernema glaseri TaxID=37863 RepID=A0A1I7YKT3_9BILA